MTRIEWQDYDDLMPFEKVLEMIRDKRLTEVTVTFHENANRLHYKLEGDADSRTIAKALGFREPPTR